MMWFISIAPTLNIMLIEDMVGFEPTMNGLKVHRIRPCYATYPLLVGNSRIELLQRTYKASCATVTPIAHMITERTIWDLNP